MPALKEYGWIVGLVLIVGLLTWFAVAVFMAASGSSSDITAWFSKPLRDANMGDVVILLAGYLFFRKT